MNTRPWELIKVTPEPTAVITSYRLRNHAEDHLNRLSPKVEATYLIIYNPWGDKNREKLVAHELSKKNR